METNFNFKSAICTSRVQSERLLSLGLKKETADMYIWIDNRASEARNTSYIPQDYFLEYYREHLIRDGSIFIPAWSLHRLIEMVRHTQYPYYVISKELPIYDALCERIEWLIKEGYFPKEYLEE